MASDPTDRDNRKPPPARAGYKNIGRYEIIKRIATGGMGAVYLGRDGHRNRDVALKILSPEQAAARPQLLERFRLEARYGKRFNHPNVVSLYQSGEEKGLHYLALEFVDGIDLHDYVNRHGKVSVRESWEIMIQATRAIDHLFRHGIVHRDLKPANFLVAHQNGRPLVKLIDFGLARKVSDESPRVTMAGSTLGTVDYMAPEQARDSRTADIRSDIYSLGCTWYHLLAGRAPFAEGGIGERVYKHVAEPPPDIRRFTPDVPDEVIAILLKMLTKDPADRYQTPVELLTALENTERASGPVRTDLLAQLDAGAPSPRTVPVPPPVRRARTGPRADVLQQEEIASDPDVDLDDDACAPPVRATPVPSGSHWLLWAGGVAVILAAAVLIGVLVRPRRPTPAPNAVVTSAAEKEPRIDPAPVSSLPSLPPAAEKAGSKTAAAPKPLTPPPASLAHLYQPQRPLDLQALRTEFEGPWRHAPAAASGVPIVHVGRLRTARLTLDFDTLAKACAAATAGRETVIEISDDGPFFVSPLVLKGSLVIRGAPGFRPLIAWDMRGAPTGAGALLTSTHGPLRLENLDVVVQAGEDRLAGMAALIQASGDIQARNCTFSVAGKHPAGVAVVRLQAGGAADRPRCRLENCFFRGNDLVALDLQAPAAEVLLDGCLLVGGDQPLLQVTGKADAPPATLRLRRSTLVARQTVMQVNLPPGAPGAAVLRCRAWDTLLARNAPFAGGRLLVVSGVLAPTSLQWTATNCLYTGWKNLLASPAKTIDDLKEWRAEWGYPEGDAAAAVFWPEAGPPELAEAPVEMFRIGDNKSVAFAATEGPGLIGCDSETVPQGRDHWPTLTFDPPAPTPHALAAEEVYPRVPTASDNHYHGERLDLADIDLGLYLQQMEKTRGLGPKVVLYLIGSGDRATSPIRLKNTSLTIVCEGDLRLIPKERTALEQPALIDLDGGDFELRGGALRFFDHALAPLPHAMLRLRGGNLTLVQCRLEGPLAAAPVYYDGLIDLEEAEGSPARTPRVCTITQALLVSGKRCVHVRGRGARLTLVNSVLLAGEDALVFTPGTSANPRVDVRCALDHNTIAVRRSAIHLADARLTGPPLEPVWIAALANVFCDPFANNPYKASLLRFDQDALGHGLLAWVGRENVYDKWLHSFAAAADAPAPVLAQPYPVWTQLWGPQADRDARLDQATLKKFVPGRDVAPQLSFLGLPPAPSGNNPGADLARFASKPSPKK